MLKALKRRIGKFEEGQGPPVSGEKEPTVRIVEQAGLVPPILWKGTVDEYRSLLVLREAELVLATAQLTGNDKADWWTNNAILQLEIGVTDLRKWIKEATERDHES